MRYILRCFLKALLVLILALSMVSPANSIVYAQDAVNPALTPDQEKALRNELAQIEQQIQEQQTILKQKQGEASSYAYDISILDAQIKQAKLKIRAHEISIQNLGKDIEVKKNTIEALSERISKSKESMARILQRTQALDNFSTIEAVLSGQKMSDFFVDIGNYSNIKKDLKVLLDEITTAKAQNEEVKQELDDKRQEEIFTKVNVEEEQKAIQASEGQKKKLLSLNKAQQSQYKSEIYDKQARATQIRNALFALRDTPAIKFGDALVYAKKAMQSTGVRPAFLLAIIQQESNLGANVGACRLTDTTTGAGIKIKSGNPISNLMKPSRDIAPFLQITAAVGRDPLKQPVSCPLDVGYGGAMGPAQFIPSTWVLFNNRVASALGESSADPWNPQDAIMASAMYLGDLGAGNGTAASEKNAACKYYSGHSCSGSNTFYGNQVMDRAGTLQANIDILQNS